MSKRIRIEMSPRRSRAGAVDARLGKRRLTQREREVLTWVACGKSNAEIGEILGISPATVGKHLERIYPKLGVENRTAAANFAAEIVGDRA